MKNESLSVLFLYLSSFYCNEITLKISSKQGTLLYPRREFLSGSWWDPNPGRIFSSPCPRSTREADLSRKKMRTKRERKEKKTSWCQAPFGLERLEEDPGKDWPKIYTLISRNWKNSKKNIFFFFKWIQKRIKLKLKGITLSSIPENICCRKKSLGYEHGIPGIPRLSLQVNVRYVFTLAIPHFTLHLKLLRYV